MGFPTYGGGAFERMGMPTSVPLLIGFVLVCLAEVIVGTMLLSNVPHAATVSYLLLPFEFAYPIGFALPFGRRWASLERSCSFSRRPAARSTRSVRGRRWVGSATPRPTGASPVLGWRDA